jgi:general secretion pathway protein C
VMALLKRYFWVIPLVVVLLCAVLAAKATNHVIEAQFLLGDSQKKAAKLRPRKPTETKTTASKDADGVVGRNIFCSACEPVKPVEVSTAPAPANPDGTPPLTSLPLALLATGVASDQTQSVATVINTASSRSGLYSVNEFIPEAGKIVAISGRYIDFENSSSKRVERLELLGLNTGPRPPDPVAAPVAAPTTAAGPENPEAAFMAEVQKGVKKIDDTHYEIDRGLVDKVLADPTTVARSARIVPSIKDGKANGFKLYAIRPNSAFAQIGMQNGDTIQAVNGFEMSSPDKALEVYTKVKSATSLSIQVLRRGQSVTMDYTIR